MTNLETWLVIALVVALLAMALLALNLHRTNVALRELRAINHDLGNYLHTLSVRDTMVRFAIKDILDGKSEQL